MWMHNVACDVMMMPVATGILVLQRLPRAPNQSTMLATSVELWFSGLHRPLPGMTTFNGTGVNLILAAIWKSSFREAKSIGFNAWFFFSFPWALLNFFGLSGSYSLLYLSRGSSQALSAYLDKAHLKRELDMLGKEPWWFFYPPS